MEENKSFEEICYDFQKRVIETFNNEQNIPFLLKYYLLRDIWMNIESHKMQMDQDMQNKDFEKVKNASQEKEQQN